MWLSFNYLLYRQLATKVYVNFCVNFKLHSKECAIYQKICATALTETLPIFVPASNNDDQRKKALCQLFNQTSFPFSPATAFKLISPLVREEIARYWKAGKKCQKPAWNKVEIFAADWSGGHSVWNWQ